MPSINSTRPKTLKWALPKTSSSPSGSRIQKKATSTRASCRSSPIKQQKPKNEMDRLASELAFTYDSLATIGVHFESLQLAYTSSQADIKKSFCATRLDPKEKELLAAYDDLGLQVTHLERKIKKMEARLQELRSQDEQHDVPSSSPSSVYSFDVSPSTCYDPAFFIDEMTSPLLIGSNEPQCGALSYANGPYYDYFMVPPMRETQSFVADPYTYYPSVAPSLFAQ